MQQALRPPVMYDVYVRLLEMPPPPDRQWCNGDEMRIVNSSLGRRWSIQMGVAAVLVVVDASFCRPKLG
jgi:hypothetical protein